MKENFQIFDKELSLIDIISKIYYSKFFIAKSIFYSLILGIIIALITPDKFTSFATFIPQTESSSKSSSSISGLASLAGINLSDFSGESTSISPLFYPRIVNSHTFKLELLSSKIYSNGEEISIRNYLLSNSNFNLLLTIKKYTIGLPSLILKSFKNVDDINPAIDIYKISEEDDLLFEILTDYVNIILNEDDGVISIVVTDKNRTIPAQVVKNTELLLQNKIIDFNSKISKDLLDFSNEQYELKKNEFNRLQDEIAIFKDQNININSSLFQNKLDRLQSEALILQSVVQQLASQVEQAKVKVNKDTPVFTVINPVNIPFKKSSISRTLIVILFVTVGLIFSIGYILSKEFFVEIYKKIISKS